MNPKTGCAINPKKKNGPAGQFIRGCRFLSLGPLITYEQLKQENDFLNTELSVSQTTISQLIKRVRELESELQNISGHLELVNTTPFFIL
jgi:hypothetical protein